MERNSTIEYISIRRFVKKYPVLSERTLRRMVAEGKVPGLQTPKAFKIHAPLFLAQLDAMSMNAAGGCCPVMKNHRKPVGGDSL